jgi:hypothetical protein
MEERGNYETIEKAVRLYIKEIHGGWNDQAWSL